MKNNNLPSFELSIDNNTDFNVVLAGNAVMPFVKLATKLTDPYAPIKFLTPEELYLVYNLVKSYLECGDDLCDDEGCVEFMKWIKENKQVILLQ